MEDSLPTLNEDVRDVSYPSPLSKGDKLTCTVEDSRCSQVPHQQVILTLVSEAPGYSFSSRGLVRAGRSKVKQI
jgi:hypothetical protein